MNPIWCCVDFEFLNADEQTTAAKRHWTVKGTTELNQPRYFWDVLTLKWNSENVLHYGRGYTLFLQEIKDCGFLQG